VGVVSHDLRNPLNTIEICAEALLDPNPPSIRGVRDMGEIIQRAAAWMQQISQDLLDRTSLEAGKLTLDRQPTVVYDVMRAAQTLFEPMADERWLSLHMETEASLPRVNGDANRLVQVLSNLVSNAMKFTPPGGEVRVSAERSSEDPTNVGVTGVRFTVSDTGVGIASEDLLHVFDWFWHARRDHRTGTGLGLGIAKGLVDAHQGVLRVKSEEGHGSTFWFTVPAWDRVFYATV
jgi:two-component system phosphate regulon sensor histidine kinase PhoR